MNNNTINCSKSNLQTYFLHQSMKNSEKESKITNSLYSPELAEQLNEEQFYHNRQITILYNELEESVKNYPAPTPEEIKKYLSQLDINKS